MSDMEKYREWIQCPAMTDELNTMLLSMKEEDMHDCF